MSKGICKLCGIEDDLKESHIVPKSIYKWIKNTSATSFLRAGKNPNLRIQDGIKIRLLCGDCEQRFSSYEKYFIENIFKPINEVEPTEQTPVSFDYNDKLFYFINSIWWRIIHYNSSNNELIKSKYWDVIQDCEKELKRFLLTFEYPINCDKIYINLLGYVEHAPPEYKNVNYFFMRSVDPFIMFDDSACFFSLRIPSFWFFGNIVGLDDEKLNVLKLNPSGDTFKVSQGYILNEYNISSFIGARLKGYQDKFNEISKNQIDKITTDALKNREKLRESKSYVASQFDILRMLEQEENSSE